MKKLTLLFLIFSIIFLIPYSCQKEIKVSKESLSAQETKFFEQPHPLTPILKKLIAAAYLQNQKEKFVNNIVKDEGVPNWEQAEVTLSSQASENGNVIVPLILEGTKEVNSFLLCKVQEQIIDIQLIKGIRYGAYGFRNDHDTLNAEGIAQLLMYFDYKIFGDSLFEVNDTRLFNKNASSRLGPATGKDIITLTPIKIVPDPCNKGINIIFISSYYGPLPNLPCTIWAPVVPPSGGGTSSGSSSSPSTGNGTGFSIGSQGGSNGGSISLVNLTVKDPCITFVGNTAVLDGPGCTTIKPIRPLTTIDIGNLTGANQTIADEKEDGLTDNDPDLKWWNENTSVPGMTYTQQARPGYQTVYNNYPKTADGNDDMPVADICKLIGGVILEEYNRKKGGIKNACAIRVSRSLNYSGIAIPEIKDQTERRRWQELFFSS